MSFEKTIETWRVNVGLILNGQLHALEEQLHEATPNGQATLTPEIQEKLEEHFGTFVEVIEEMTTALTEGTGNEEPEEVAAYNKTTALESIEAVKDVLSNLPTAQAAPPKPRRGRPPKDKEAKPAKAKRTGGQGGRRDRPKLSPKTLDKLPVKLPTPDDVDKLKRPQLMHLAAQLKLAGKGTVVSLRRRIKAKLTRLLKKT